MTIIRPMQPDDKEAVVAMMEVFYTSPAVLSNGSAAIFTNDFEWAKSHFTDEDCYFVQGNTGKESYRDMQLMSLCEHNVIANSSFSWWGAWLNANKEKTVIAPEKWVNSEEDTTAVVPESWMKMKG